MSTENLKTFIERVNSDPALKTRIQALPTSTDGADDLAKISIEIGIPVTSEEFRSAARAASSSDELSATDLEGVAGGVAVTSEDIDGMLLQAIRGKGHFSRSVTKPQGKWKLSDIE